MKHIVLSSLLGCIFTVPIFAAMAPIDNPHPRVDSLMQLCTSALVRDAMGPRGVPVTPSREDLLNPTALYAEITRTEEAVAELLQTLPIYAVDPERAASSTEVLDPFLDAKDVADCQTAAWRIAIAGDRLREQVGRMARQQVSLEGRMISDAQDELVRARQLTYDINHLGNYYSGALPVLAAWLMAGEYTFAGSDSHADDVVQKVFGLSYDELMNKVRTCPEQDVAALQGIWDAICPELLSYNIFNRRKFNLLSGILGGMAMLGGREIEKRQRNDVQRAFYSGVKHAGFIVLVGSIFLEAIFTLYD